MYSSEHLRNPQNSSTYTSSSPLTCNWGALRKQLLLQWPRIDGDDLDRVGPNCERIALIIQSQYRVSYKMIENYLRNFERTMPLQ